MQTVGMPMSTVSPNQLVAYNLERVRKMRGLSQEEARELLKAEGIDWSKAVYSAAERSWDGKRVRQFEANHLVAFSRAFGVPVVFFFLPPRAADRIIGAGSDRTAVSGVSAGGADISWPEMFEVMLGGTYRSVLLPRFLELPPEDRPAASTRLGQLIGLLSANGTAVAERDRMATERRDRNIQRAADAVFPVEPDVNGERPIALAIVVSGGRVLVAERVDGVPPWTFPGGEVEPDDDAGETVVRETKEETGVELEAVRIIGRRDHPVTHRHTIYVEGTLKRGPEAYVGDPAELKRVRWVGLDELLELMPTLYEPVREHLTREVGAGTP
jgi:8-oxo-dGTP diphosphatase